MTESSYAYLDSPLGVIEIGGRADAVLSVAFVETAREEATANPLLEAAGRQLAEYFAGTRAAFDLRLALQGTPFQLRVWAQMLGVPLGETVSYQHVARAVGLNRGARAVGAAAGQNPMAIIVPCHRVVGSNGGLTGYGAGLWRKEWLLRHESAILV